MTERLQQSILKAQDWGFIGGDLDQHLDHSLAFVDILQSLGLGELSGVDLGSGGGLPGLIILSQMPETRLALVEVMGKRAAFLEQAIIELEFNSRAQVVRRRAEELAHDELFRERYSFVTARSFAGPGVTAEVAAGFLKVGGVLVVSEPPDSAGERWSSAGLDRLGLRFDGLRKGIFGFAVLIKVQGCHSSYPRVAGKAWKQPLF
jgi:16S rRNA (guanine527-N7)-methyltransferase